MTVLDELGQLIRTAPGLQAPPTQVAHWYELKAHMLEQLAQEDEASRPTALRQAAAAHQHATALLALAS
ncbi:MAG TPA: hypothetical protein VGR06_06170 [Actinophytocola sp.]|jgi:hypothetical protein|uniref:hypothetical protein n=1 Tax=Actinophytocola sp. TaxID=1872138 RepID=UPI002E046842|nr:hypothetical protein [Actinophytocola sp.]